MPGGWGWVLRGSGEGVGKKEVEITFGWMGKLDVAASLVVGAREGDRRGVW